MDTVDQALEEEELRDAVPAEVAYEKPLVTENVKTWKNGRQGMGYMESWVMAQDTHKGSNAEEGRAEVDAAGDVVVV